MCFFVVVGWLFFVLFFPAYTLFANLADLRWLHFSDGVLLNRETNHWHTIRVRTVKDALQNSDCQTQGGWIWMKNYVPLFGHLNCLITKIFFTDIFWKMHKLLLSTKAYNSYSYMSSIFSNPLLQYRKWRYVAYSSNSSTGKYPKFVCQYRTTTEFWEKNGGCPCCTW